MNRILVATILTLAMGACTPTQKKSANTAIDLGVGVACMFIAAESTNPDLAKVCATQAEIDSAVARIIDTLPTLGEARVKLTTGELIATTVLAGRAGK